MTTRREFIQVSALAGLAGTGWMPGAYSADVSGMRVGYHRSHRIIYDTRFAGSTAFGREARASGFEVRPVDGDVTRLWVGDLASLWKTELAAIAGMTAADVLFCLEQFARDADLRIVHRTVHPETGAPGVLTPAATTPLPADPREQVLAVSRCKLASPAQTATCLPPMQEGDHEPLITWVIGSRVG
jgi:hypothetical protein